MSDEQLSNDSFFCPFIFLSTVRLTVVGPATKKWTEKLGTEKYDDGLRPEPKYKGTTETSLMTDDGIFYPCHQGIRGH